MVGPTPVTTPEDEPTVATVVVPLVHIPPATPSLKLIVAPLHTVVVVTADIAVGAAVTVIECVVIHPPTV